MVYTRLLRWVSLSTAVLACLWFSPSLLDPFNIPKLTILVVGAALMVGLLVGNPKAWLKREEWSIWVGVGLFILGLSAAAVASDQNSYRTLWGAWARNNGWLAYAALAVLALAVASAFRGKDARLGLWALIGVGYVQIVYSLLQTTGNDPVNWNNGYNPILGTLGNPNFASALLGISAVAMVWAALDRGVSTALRITHVLLAVTAVWLTLRSESIQGTLAFGAGFAVLIGTWLSDAQQHPQLRRLVVPYISVGVLGFGFGVWGLTGGGPLATILYSQNLVNRTYYWRAGWNMFKQDPLFGIGLDSFGDWYRIVRVPEQVAATGVQTVSNTAHSVIFQMLGTGGIAMFGTYVLLQIIAIWRGVVAIRSGQNRLLVGAIFGTWTAFLLQSLFSIDQLGLTVWGWVTIGLLVGVSYTGGPPGGKGPSKSRRRTTASSNTDVLIPVGLSALLGIAAIAYVYEPLTIESELRTAVSFAYDPQQPNLSAQVGIKEEVLQALEGANDPYWLATGVNKLFTIGMVDEGLKLAESSAKRFPRDITLWQLVATAYEQTGRAQLAVPWRARTVELDPQNTEYVKKLAADKESAA